MRRMKKEPKKDNLIPLNLKIILYISIVAIVFVSGCTQSGKMPTGNSEKPKIQETFSKACESLEEGNSEKLLEQFTFSKNSKEYENYKGQMETAFKLTDFKKCDAAVKNVSISDKGGKATINLTTEIKVSIMGVEKAKEQSIISTEPVRKVNGKWKIDSEMKFKK